jgi:hypothetical protein
LVLHSRRWKKKILDLQRLAGDGENYLKFFIKWGERGSILINNYLKFFIKWGVRGSILINDVAGTELDYVVTRIHLDFLGPNRNDVGLFVLVDPDKKIFIIRRQIT